MDNELSSIVQIEMQGMNMAFEIGSKVAGVALQSFVRMLNIISAGRKLIGKGVTEHKDKKIVNLSGKVEMSQLKLREGENLSLFKIKDAAMEDFDKAMIAMNIPYAELPDFNREDGYKFIMLGSTHDRNVNYILEELLAKNLKKENQETKEENVGEKVSVKEYIDANSVDENGNMDVKNFTNSVEELEKASGISINKTPNESSTGLSSTEAEKLISNVKEIENTKELENISSDKIRVSQSVITDEDEHMIYLDIGNDDKLMISKESVVFNDNKYEMYLNFDNESIVTLNGERISSGDVKKLLKDRESKLLSFDSKNKKGSKKLEEAIDKVDKAISKAVISK